MAELGPELSSEIVAACQAGAAEAGEAFSRTLDATVSVSVGEPGSLQLDSPPEGFDGPGLIIVLEIGSQAVVVVLPETGGLLPDWYAKPDPTGESRLSTLAQELGMLLLPESCMPESFHAGSVQRLDEALRRGGVADEAGLVPLELSADDKRATVSLIWPVAEPGSVYGEPSGETKADDSEQPSPPAEKPDAGGESDTPEKSEASQPAPSLAAQELPAQKTPLSVRSLPPYARSLLRVRVPVTVTLASKRQSIGKILELGTGSIIQFEKSCEELLDLQVGDHTCAKGEAVKVGDKFGIRLTSLVLPDERFGPLQTQRPEGNER